MALTTRTGRRNREVFGRAGTFPLVFSNTLTGLAMVCAYFNQMVLDW